MNFQVIWHCHDYRYQNQWKVALQLLFSLSTVTAGIIAKVLVFEEIKTSMQKLLRMGGTCRKSVVHIIEQ